MFFLIETEKGAFPISTSFQFALAQKNLYVRAAYFGGAHSEPLQYWSWILGLWYLNDSLLISIALILNFLNIIVFLRIWFKNYGFLSPSTPNIFVLTKFCLKKTQITSFTSRVTFQSWQNSLYQTNHCWKTAIITN